MFKKFSKLFFPLFIILILGLSLRGLPGVPNSHEINSPVWKENGPFELSPERGRFALLYSIVEDHSFQFSDEVGKFAIPDIGISNGRYVSLFAPLLSFVTIPGYIIGKYFGASQVGTFAVISLFALINVLLIRSIAIFLGARPLAANIGGMSFLFATPAFSYAVNLYQHHLSTFLILLSIYSLLRFKGIWSLLLVFFLCALAIPLDYPNLFFMFPIGVFALGRIISFKSVRKGLSIQINLLWMLAPVIMIIPVMFFLWFNQVSFGSPFQLSGTLPTPRSTTEAKKVVTNTGLQAQFPIPDQNHGNDKQAIKFFKSRDLLNGFYIHLISPDRGVIYYAPVVLFGVLGAVLAFRKGVYMIPLLVAIIGANILLYSMWGDPWGGWAFGSRYLIPSFAILSIFTALAISYWRRKILFMVIFLAVFSYSVAVNTLGAITSSANPPQVEVLNLEKLSGKVQKYTYERSWDFLVSDNSKSFIFQAYVKNYLSAVQYYQLLVALIVFVGLSMAIYLFPLGRRKYD